MIALETALQTWFTANSGDAFPGGIWVAQAEEGTQMPYVTMTVIAAPVTQGYNSKRSQSLIQLSAFGTDHDTLGTDFEALATLLDNTILSLSSGQMSDIRRLDEPHDDELPPDGSGQAVWRWMCQYQFTVRS